MLHRNDFKLTSHKLNNMSAGHSLHDYFPPSNEPQRRSMPESESTRASQPDNQKLNVYDTDAIEDGYDSYDEIFSQYLAEKKATCRMESKATLTDGGRLPARGNSDRPRNFGGNSRRFIMPSAFDRSQDICTPVSNCEKKPKALPWAQRYPPLSLDELAVHKRKVTEVRTWLSSALDTNANKLLVLRGPAGSGKTTTVSLLSEVLGFDILEWKNPPASDFATEEYTPIVTQFEEFLSRSNRLRGLDLYAADSSPMSGTKGTIHRPRQRIVLIEEFPAVARRGSSSLAAFRLSLQRYLAVPPAPNGLPWNGSERHTNSPIVVIVSETLLDCSSLDNLTVHRLLGADVLNHPSTTVIDFNSIAPTFMYKALNLVVEKNSRFSKLPSGPGPTILKRISETGDIRSAISSLEFLCVKSERFENHGYPPINTKRSTRGTMPTMPIEKEELQLISQREASLGLFHAVGKIVYNKRDDVGFASDNSRPPQPPDHLSHHDRPKISQVSVNELLDEAGTDTQTFISALHENYVPSCDGPGFIDCLNGCIEALSDSDLLCVHKKGFRAGLPQTTNNATVGLDMLRQDELSYQIAARGLLFSLPSPVKRRISSTSQRGAVHDRHKIFFPTELRMWKERDEADGLLRLWTARSLYSLSALSGHVTKSMTDCSRNELVDGNAEAVIVTTTTRNDLLLYQLPYMASFHLHGSASSKLRKLTCFHGQRTQNAATDDDTFDLHPGDPDRASSLSRPLKHAEGLSHSEYARPWLPSAGLGREDKLILSDDDIEDS